ncbi:hypothetical protein LTR08_008006 [Meristemomyces frigidus]|nr:hypothetical protein LTR08_008006 [Meristemomyces frigidus]
MAQDGAIRPATPVSPQWSGPAKEGMRRLSQGSGGLSPDGRKSVMEQAVMGPHEAPVSPVSIGSPAIQQSQSEVGAMRDGLAGESDCTGSPGKGDTPHMEDSLSALPVRSRAADGRPAHSRASSGASGPPRIEEFGPELEPPEHGPLQHSAQADDEAAQKPAQKRASQATVRSAGSASSGAGSEGRQSQYLAPARAALSRPASAYTLAASDLRGRTLSPLSANGSDPSSPRSFARDVSSSRRSPSSRPMSYIDLLSNVPYNQQVAPGPPLNNSSLQNAVGKAASLLATKKTLEMYRANVKKTNDAAVQYEFAIFMVNAARDSALPATSTSTSPLPSPGDSALDPAELIQEAKHILQRLSDRAYPFAQYYLADGYFSGLFTHTSAPAQHPGKPDHDKAFPLFLAASKHGHAEAGYRAALCYEFGWGTARNYAKAVQFHRAAAAKNHPGAATRLGLACLRGDMGLLAKRDYREGLKWLKRAAESADPQYNSAPYELGLLHLQGFGAAVFKDEHYAAQLLTQSADLAHPQANFLLGRAYELGTLGCPRDAALSVHFYNGAATHNHAEAMLALCAWFLVGFPPLAAKDEHEAFAWASQAAELGLPKAQYACGYFTEMGIGCRRDPLEANVWYVRAAGNGDETARQRLRVIREAVDGRGAGTGEGAGEGAGGRAMVKGEAKTEELGGGGKQRKKSFMGIF